MLGNVSYVFQPVGLIMQPTAPPALPGGGGCCPTAGPHWLWWSSPGCWAVLCPPVWLWSHSGQLCTALDSAAAPSTGLLLTRLGISSHTCISVPGTAAFPVAKKPAFPPLGSPVLEGALSAEHWGSLSNLFHRAETPSSSHGLQDPL